MTPLELVALAGTTTSGPIRVSGSTVGRVQTLGLRVEFRDASDRLIATMTRGHDGKATVVDAGGRTLARVGR